MGRSGRSGCVMLRALGTLAVLGLIGLTPTTLLGQTPVKDAAGGEVDLLAVAPFDRLTLGDGAVILVEPVVPRPLPAFDPAKAARARQRRTEVPREGNIPLPGEKPATKAADAEDERNAELNVHLLTGDVRDFTLKRANLKSIEYFEDLLLAEGERLGLARDFNRAFECYLKVQARDPSWRGLDDHVNRLLFNEGSVALLGDDGERGLRILRELAGRKPDYPGLGDKLASSYGARAIKAFELGLHAQARRILHDAEPLAPDHPILRGVRETMVNRARALAQSAAAAAARHDPAARVDALAEALRVWPTLEGAEAAYREAFAAAPTLDVAVDDVPRSVGPWVHSPADARVTRLLYLPILARDDLEAAATAAAADPSAAAAAPVAGQLALNATAADLGRRVRLKLRADVNWADGSRPVSAIDVSRALTDMAEPTSPRYQARWADLLDRVEAADETQVDVRLTRAVLKPGSWLMGPVGPAHGGGDGRVAGVDRGRELVGDGPYRYSDPGPGRGEFRPTAAAPGTGPARLKEQRHPNGRATLGALARGEATLVEHVPQRMLPALSADPAYKVGRYARPSVHRIALDGRNPALRSRSLRRGLSYAIDRKGLLEDAVLGRPAGEADSVADGPFPRGVYADAPDVKPLAYEPWLARMLVAAARKELGDRPIPLRFEYPATPEAQSAAPRLAEAFRAAGLLIALEERPESELEAELRAGRRFDLAYRASRCDEPVVDAGPLIAPAYDAPPAADPLASVPSPRILQLLLQLERAPEWTTARALAVQIDRECRDELPALPLWQVEDHYAWRTRLRGPKGRCDDLYEDLQGWQVDPWFAKDSW